MIWRRLRLKGDTTLAAFHYIIQRCFGCDDDYLHEFRIFAKDYGMNKGGAVCFGDNTYHIGLQDFEFDTGDRFTYTYNFNQNWVFDIRVELIEPESKRKKTPFCISGQGMLEATELDYYEQLNDVLRTIFIVDDEKLTVGDVRRKIEALDQLHFNPRKTIQHLTDLNLNNPEVETVFYLN